MNNAAVGLQWIADAWEARMGIVPNRKREDSLGLFVPLARAYGRADALTRAQVDAAGRSYEARLITEDTYLARLSELLQVPMRERAA